MGSTYDCAQAPAGRRAYLGETLQSKVARGGRGEELEQQLHNVGLQHIPQGHPGEIRGQRGQRGSHEVSLLGGIQHKQAQLVDEAELLVEGVLQLCGLRLCTSKIQ